MRVSLVQLVTMSEHIQIIENVQQSEFHILFGRDSFD